MQSESGSTPAAQLQALRGLAALTVLIHHALRTVPGGGATWFVSERILNAHAAVVVFFVLSGYVLTLSLQRRSLGPESVAAFYLRRAFRIYPALFVGVGLGVAYILTWPAWPGAVLSAWASSALTPGPITAQALALNLSGLGTSLLPPLWTIKVELVASVVLPLLVWCATRGTMLALASVATLAVLSFMAQSAVPLYLVQFAIGAAVAAFQRSGGMSFSGWITMAAAIVLIGFRNLWPWDYHDPLPSLVEGFAGAVVIASIIRGGGGFLASRPLVLIGDWSYGIYLFHLPIAFAFARWISTSPLAPDTQALAVTALTLATTVPLSWLVFEHIERPGINFGHRLSARLTQGVAVGRSRLARRGATSARAKPDTTHD